MLAAARALEQCRCKEGLGRHGRRSRVRTLAVGPHPQEDAELGRMKFPSSAESVLRLKKEGRKQHRKYYSMAAEQSFSIVCGLAA